VADAQHLGHAGNAFQDLVGDFLGHEQARTRGADLSGVEKIPIAAAGIAS
jgi:hypothetical protein